MAERIVVDTSVLIKWIKTRDEEFTDEARSLLELIESKPCEVFVPTLLLYEVGNILLRKSRLGPDALAAAIDQVWALPFTVVSPGAELLRRTARLGRLLGLTFYDASFLALAEHLDCLIVTADRRLYKSAHGLPRLRHVSEIEKLS